MRMNNNDNRFVTDIHQNNNQMNNNNKFINNLNQQLSNNMNNNMFNFNNNNNMNNNFNLNNMNITQSNFQVDNANSNFKKYYDYEWQAYATLGRLFIMNDELNNIELGHAISLKLSEENNMTESLFAMGYYWYYRMGTQYYEQALPYFERALNNDNSFWAEQALRYYNGVAQYANEEYRGPNGQIQYYQE